MEWGICNPAVDVATFGRIELIENLIYCDIPRIFMAKSTLGDLLCFLADYEDETLRYIFAPTNQSILEQLKNGSLPLRKALDQPSVWFVDVGHNEIPVAAWQGTLADVPADILPDGDFVL